MIEPAAGRFWFSFKESAAGITYTFHNLGDEVEVGVVPTLAVMFDRFDALVRRNVH